MPVFTSRNNVPPPPPPQDAPLWEAHCPTPWGPSGSEAPRNPEEGLAPRLPAPHLDLGEGHWEGKDWARRRGPC